MTPYPRSREVQEMPTKLQVTDKVKCEMPIPSLNISVKQNQIITLSEEDMNDTVVRVCLNKGFLKIIEQIDNQQEGGGGGGGQVKITNISPRTVSLGEVGIHLDAGKYEYVGEYVLGFQTVLDAVQLGLISVSTDDGRTVQMTDTGIQLIEEAEEEEVATRAEDESANVAFPQEAMEAAFIDDEVDEEELEEELPEGLTKDEHGENIADIPELKKDKVGPIAWDVAKKEPVSVDNKLPKKSETKFIDEPDDSVENAEESEEKPDEKKVAKKASKKKTAKKKASKKKASKKKATKKTSKKKASKKKTAKKTRKSLTPVGKKRSEPTVDGTPSSGNFVYANESEGAEIDFIDSGTGSGDEITDVLAEQDNQRVENHPKIVRQNGEVE